MALDAVRGERLFRFTRAAFSAATGSEAAMRLAFAAFPAVGTFSAAGLAGLAALVIFAIGFSRAGPACPAV